MHQSYTIKPYIPHKSRIIVSILHINMFKAEFKVRFLNFHYTFMNIAGIFVQAFFEYLVPRSETTLVYIKL